MVGMGDHTLYVTSWGWRGENRDHRLWRVRVHGVLMAEVATISSDPWDAMQAWMTLQEIARYGLM